MLRPTVEEILCILQKLTKKRTLFQPLSLLSYMCLAGFKIHASLAHCVSLILVEVGNRTEIKFLSKKLVYIDCFSLDTTITWLVRCGKLNCALMLFRQAQDNGFIQPLRSTIVALLKACAKLENVETGLEIHHRIKQMGVLENDPFIGSSLVDMYIKCGLPSRAREAFYQQNVQDTVLWNALISGFAKRGHNKEALRCFEQMQLECFTPDAVTFVSILKACGSLLAKRKIYEIHSEIEINGLLKQNRYVRNALVDAYINCRSLSMAKHVFDKFLIRDVVSWNVIIAGYAEHGHNSKSIKCFEQMQREDVYPDAVTFIGVLKACANTENIVCSQEIHVEIARRELLERNFVGNVLVDVYSKFGFLNKAQEVFAQMSARDVFSWNALIAGYAKHGVDTDTLNCFNKMQLQDVIPDAATYIAVMKMCGSFGVSDKGRQIHALLEGNKILYTDISVAAALVDMYAKCDLLPEAQELFNKLSVHDLVSWTSLIGGYAEYGHGKQALNCYEQMQLDHISPDRTTYLCCLKACTSAGVIDKGWELHAEIEQKGLLKGDLFVANSLIDMYAKLGLLVEAQYVFDKIHTPDIVSWNSLIAGYTEHERFDKALKCFDRMQNDGLTPNTITFIFSLKACCSMGAIDLAVEIHADIERRGFLEKDIVIGNTLVNMYAKSGMVDKAQQVFEKLHMKDVVSWNALIAGYTLLGDSENAFDAFEQMPKDGINPGWDTFLISLSGCNRAGLFHKGLMHFESMNQDYGVVPTLEHLTCLVDLFSRTGQLDKAVELIMKFHVCPDLHIWFTIMGACVKWGNLELGRQAFENALCLHKSHAASYILLSSAYAQANL